MRVCRIATVPFFLLHHLGTQIRATAAAGHELLLVASPGPEWIGLRAIPGARAVEIPIARPISPFGDLRALFALWRCLRENRIDILHSTTPKAGLLAAIAGRLARVPVRLHTFTGQAWAELSGPMRSMAKAADRLIVQLNTRCYADSASQREFLIEQGVAAPNQIAVLGPGSLAGVDVRELDPDRYCEDAASVRSTLGIPGGSKVIAFLGRLTRDKGVPELVEAFSLLRPRFADLHLILVGPEEPERDPLPEATRTAIASDSRVHAVGYDPSPTKYLAISDLLCLPSRREGFGNVVIEAAAMGVPAVGTRITGLSDAIVDGRTGVLVAPGNPAALAEALAVLLFDETCRRAMGRAARERAVRDFDAAAINGFVLAEYERLRAARRT